MIPHLGHAELIPVVAAAHGHTQKYKTKQTLSGDESKCKQPRNLRLYAVVALIVTAITQTVVDIDPGELWNIKYWLASEYTQATPQRSCLKRVAS